MISRGKLLAAGVPAALALALTGEPTLAAAEPGSRCDRETVQHTAVIGGQEIDLTVWANYCATTTTVETAAITAYGRPFTVTTEVFRFTDKGSVRTAQAVTTKGTSHGRWIMRKIPSRAGWDGYIRVLIRTDRETRSVVLFV